MIPGVFVAGTIYRAACQPRPGETILGEGFALGPEGAHHVPAVDAGPVVETTGAGDAFTGAFAAALAEGRTPLEAMRFGCAAAAISVTRPGTAASMPARAEIDALLACG